MDLRSLTELPLAQHNVTRKSKLLEQVPGRLQVYKNSLAFLSGKCVPDARLIDFSANGPTLATYQGN
jgi:hypothetical protein